MKQEKSKTGYGWKALSLFLAVVIVLSGIVFGIFCATGDIRFGKEETEKQEQEESAEAGGDDAYGMPKKMAFSARSLASALEEGGEGEI